MISVIIPTYKRAEYLERAIDSVLNQTYQDFEIIVVDDNDDGSEYRIKTEEKMKKYINNRKVVYLKHERNLNGAAARNTGIKNAKGKIITFLDDDDFFISYRLEHIINYINKNENVKCLYTGYIDVCDNKIIHISSNRVEGDLKIKMLMQESFFGTGSNLVFDANVLKELNGFDVTFRRHQDIEMMVRFFRKYEIKYLDSYSLVRDKSSQTNIPNISNAIKYREHFLQTFEKDIKKCSNNNIIYKKNYLDIYKQCNKKNKKEKKDILLKLKEMNIKISLYERLIYFIKSFKVLKMVKINIRKFKAMIRIDKHLRDEIINIYNRYMV